MIVFLFIKSNDILNLYFILFNKLIYVTVRRREEKEEEEKRREEKRRRKAKAKAKVQILFAQKLLKFINNY